ncbi:MAG: transporter [Flavobacteriaceae bacterium]|nr:transporter [Flavobacteriaceae bacterium]
MKTKTKILFLTLFFLGITINAQNLPQPPGNYGLTSALDGSPPMPGLYLMEYFSYYSGTLKDQNGKNVVPNGTDKLKISSTLLLNQLVWITNKKVLDGNLFFGAIVPVVLLDTKNPYDLVGKSGVGDVTIGTGVQWFNKKLFGKTYFHRLEFEYTLPVGAYNDELGTKPINAGSKFSTFQPTYSQTIMLNKSFSISLKHHLSFNGIYKEIPNVDVRVGTFYHMNYSLEHLIGKSRFQPGVSGETRLGVQGYYGVQLNDDKVNGVNLANSKESVFAIGPNLHLLTKKGLVLEFKAAFETSAVNRPQGVRSTIRLIKLFNPKPKK